MMLIKRCFTALLACCIAVVSPAVTVQAKVPESASAAKASAAATDAHARPALWKVADADTTIYLFGTIHLLPSDVVWFDGAVAEAFRQSQELVTEIPEVAPTAQQAAFVQRALLPPGPSLRTALNKKDRARFEATMRKLGLPVGAFDRFKPWYAAIVMATLPLQQRGYDIENGVEAQLDAAAKQRQIPRSGLETLDYQLSLFDQFPQKTQISYLMDVIKALPDLDKDVSQMIGAWRSGNAAKLAELMNAEEDDPAMIEALLTRRNQAWAQWINARLAQPGTVFVAVGAGHLGGQGSVQDELAKAGVASLRVQ